jgi:CRISPR type IV-associated protein Csf1
MFNCFYCGSKCDDNNRVKDYVKKSFTNHDIVFNPESEYICDDCVYFTGSKIDIIMIDGEIRNSVGRSFSWIVTKNEKLAASKSHIKELRKIILNPPEPPFKIILSDSGKKNLAFRCRWQLEKDNYYLQFEEESILINIEDLKNRLYLADRLSAAIGKVAIKKCDAINYAVAIENYYHDLSDYESWLKIMNEPLSRLAVWLAKNKEDASNEYPAINGTGVQTEISGANRPTKKNERVRVGSDEGRSDQIHFDFT